MYSRRRAFTLVETVVSAMVGFLVLGCLWALVSGSERSRARSDATLQGVHAAIQFEEPLERDLRALYSDGRHGVAAAPTNQRAALEFWIADAAASRPEAGAVVLHRVRYAFDSARGAVTRQVDDQALERLPGSFEDVIFRVDAPPEYQAMPPATPSLEELPGAAGQVTYLVTCIPQELVARAPEVRKPSDRVVLCGSLPLTCRNGRFRHSFWLPNPSTASGGPPGR